MPQELEVGMYGEAYCVKDRRKTTFEIAEVKELRNGTIGYKGKCPDCGSGVMRIGKKVTIP